MPKSFFNSNDIFNRNDCGDCYDCYRRNTICSWSDQKTHSKRNNDTSESTTDPANHKEEKDELHGTDNAGKSSRRDSLSLADELSKFVKLREQGVLSEEEFARIKKDLLDGKT
jgi:hypothetical protein